MTISATILQNKLKRKLPQEFLQELSGGVEIAFAVIPALPALPEPLRTEVRVAFAESLATIWKVLAGISAAGFLAVMLMREVPMPTFTDDQFGLREDAQGTDAGAQLEKGTAPAAEEPEKQAGVDTLVVGTVSASGSRSALL